MSGQSDRSGTFAFMSPEIIRREKYNGKACLPLSIYIYDCICVCVCVRALVHEINLHSHRSRQTCGVSGVLSLSCATSSGLTGNFIRCQQSSSSPPPPLVPHR